MHLLQVVPAVMEVGRGVGMSGAGAGLSVTTSFVVVDPDHVEHQEVGGWVSATNGREREPPTGPAVFETLPGASEMRVIPYTVTGDRTTNDLAVFPRDFFTCKAGYDYYLLQKMIDVDSVYVQKVAEDGMSEVQAVMESVRPKAP